MHEFRNVVKHVGDKASKLKIVSVNSRASLMCIQHLRGTTMFLCSRYVTVFC